MKRIILTIISWVIICSPAWADTSVWKVTKNGSELFIGGTCHILRSSDYPIPDEFDRAYAASHSIVLETDLGKMNTPEAQQKLLSRMIYTDGTSLKDHLNPQTYDILNSYCEANGFSLNALISFKPTMVMVTLTLIELQKMGISQEGVDMHYYRQGLQDSKPLLKLETVDEQIDIIAAMGIGYEDKFVRHSIEELKRIRDIIEKLIHQWKQGNSRGIYRLFIEPVKQDFPQVYDAVLLARNNAWMPKIKGFLDNPEKEFVLVGFAHLVGEDGIIEQLRKAGYAVEKF